MNDTPILSRLLALVLDLFMCVAFFTGLLRMLIYLEIPIQMDALLQGDWQTILYFYLYFAGFYFFYEMLFSGLFQSSPGKIIMNAEVEFTRGHTFGNVFSRSFFKTVTVMLGPATMFISYMIAVIRGSSTVIHDMISRSKVTNECRSPRLFGLLLFVSAIVLIYFFYRAYQQELFDFHFELPQLYEGLV